MGPAYTTMMGTTRIFAEQRQKRLEAQLRYWSAAGTVAAIIHPSSPYLGANPETSDQSNLWLQPQWRSQ